LKHIQALYHFSAWLAILTWASVGVLPGLHQFERCAGTDGSDLNTAFIRSRVQTFDVRSASTAVSRVTIETTILGPAGRDYGEVIIYYDRYRHIKDLSGHILDADGKVVKKLRKEQIEDVSAVSDESLYEEGRYRIARQYHPQYPYTVVYSYEIRHEGLLSWPTWYAGEQSIPTLYTRFVVAAPRTIEVRYSLRGLSTEPQTSSSGDRQTYVWELRSLSPFEPEPWGPSWSEQRPAVRLAPSSFEIENIPGDMTSWAGFGKWYGELTGGRDRLSEKVTAVVRTLTDGVADPIDRARLVYEFVQDRTRYVSVQLGIGKWQPEEARVVHERGYGDCKALTNYTMALLGVAGVPAYPALIRSGTSEPTFDTDFPCNLYNHMILFLPTEPEPVWLECTSQTMPFGHIGAANESRYALVVKPEGGELIRTPTSSATHNSQQRIVLIDIEPNTDATASVTTTYTGSRADFARDLVGGAGASWHDNLRDIVDIPNFQITAAERINDGLRRDTVVIRMTVDLPGMASRVGSRLFVSPNLMERWTDVPPAMEDRTQPVLFPYAFTDEDSVVIRFPPRLEVETLPDVVEISSDFGSFRAEVQSEGPDLIRYTRRLRIDRKEIPAPDYHNVVTFFSEVARADSRQVVLKRKK
jgi:transglutaminase-like putative cysteine protease